MSKKIAPRVQLNFEPEIIKEPEPEDKITEVEGLPIEVPEVIERDEIVEKDIFDNINPSLNGMGEDIVIDEVEPQGASSATPKPKEQPKPQAQPKQAQTKQKTKRKLSEEHKAKLALAREKALATRRAKAEEKKKMKEIEAKTKELKKKKAQKDLEQLEDEVVNDKPVKTSLDTTQGARQANYPTSMFTKKDLEDAQLEAIMKYETIRKARKEEKKKQQMIDQQKKDLQKKIQGYGARDTNGRLVNRWDACY